MSLTKFYNDFRSLSRILCRSVVEKCVECVVFNACYSEVQANAIARHIPYVIGIKQAVGDNAAQEFSEEKARFS